MLAQRYLLNVLIRGTRQLEDLCISKITMKEECYNRLSKSYTKRGVEKLFVDQFMVEIF